MEKLNIGEFIKPLDEEYIYQINNFHEDNYACTSISNGCSRWFNMNANHYVKATQEEVNEHLKNSNLRFNYWVADKKDEIISNGFVIAKNYERAKEIFNEKLKSMKKTGEYFLSETPESFIKQY